MGFLDISNTHSSIFFAHSVSWFKYVINALRQVSSGKPVTAAQSNAGGQLLSNLVTSGAMMSKNDSASDSMKDMASIGVVKI